MTTPLEVRHGSGAYAVHIMAGALLELDRLVRSAVGPRPVVLVSDTTVLQLYDEWTSGTQEARQLGARASDAGMRLRVHLRLDFPPGESSKTRRTWADLTDRMLEAGIGRDAVLVAMGGGVAGDLGGFVAATYLRGIPCVQVPTSLVAMVDAAIGGKVGVDTAAGKNLVGAFHQPALVVADPLTLMSLPEREYRGGLAEAVKHGLVADAEYFDWIEANIRPLRQRQPAALETLVRGSVAIKAGVVHADEREAGQRAILNAGHTAAHALEHASGWTLTHGDAVAIGLVAETALAARMGLADDTLVPRLRTVLQRLGLPVDPPGGFDQGALRTAMSRDKKNRGEEVRCALSAAVGRTHQPDGNWTTPIDPRILASLLTSSG